MPDLSFGTKYNRKQLSKKVGGGMGSGGFPVPASTGPRAVGTPSSSMPTRSNAGGAVRGQARAAQVKGMNTAKRKPRPRPRKRK